MQDEKLQRCAGVKAAHEKALSDTELKETNGNSTYFTMISKTMIPENKGHNLHGTIYAFTMLLVHYSIFSKSTGKNDKWYFYVESQERNRI